MTYPVPSPAHNEAPIVVNFKVPEIPGSPMLTLRASQGIELEALSADVAHHGHALGKSLTEFRAGILAGSGVQGVLQPPQAPSVAPQGAPAQPAAYQPPAQQYAAPAPAGPPGIQAPTCPHGVREYKSGVSQKTGKPYKMWTCPETNRDAQCSPEWVK